MVTLLKNIAQCILLKLVSNPYKNPHSTVSARKKYEALRGAVINWHVREQKHLALERQSQQSECLQQALSCRRCVMCDVVLKHDEEHTLSDGPVCDRCWNSLPDNP